MTHDQAANIIHSALESKHNTVDWKDGCMLKDAVKALLDGYQATGEAIQDAITRIEGHEPTSMVNAAYKTATLALLDTLLSKWRGPAPGREE
jgi:hypothetical protein